MIPAPKGTSVLNTVSLRLIPTSGGADIPNCVTEKVLLGEKRYKFFKQTSGLNRAMNNVIKYIIPIILSNRETYHNIQ